MNATAFPWRHAGDTARRPPPSASVLSLLTWVDHAACRGRTHLFFGPHAERPEERQRREVKAREVCLACPVLEPCRGWARERREYGFWGGRVGGGTGGRRLPGGPAHGPGGQADPRSARRPLGVGAEPGPAAPSRSGHWPRRLPGGAGPARVVSSGAIGRRHDPQQNGGVLTGPLALLVEGTARADLAS